MICLISLLLSRLDNQDNRDKNNDLQNQQPMDFDNDSATNQEFDELFSCYIDTMELMNKITDEEYYKRLSFSASFTKSMHVLTF